MAVRLLGLVVVCALQAACASGPNVSAIQELMVRAGLDEQTRQMWIALRTDVSEGRKGSAGADARILERVEHELAVAVDTEATRATLKDRLSRELTPVEVEAALGFFRSPVGRQIADLQASAWTLERLRSESLPGEPAPAGAHIEALRRLGLQTHTLQVFLAWSACRLTGPLLVRLPPSEGAPQPGTPAFKAAVDGFVEMGERVLREIDAALLSEFADSPAYEFIEALYRPLTEEAREQYREFAKSPAGSKFYRTSGRVIARDWVAACMAAGYRVRAGVAGSTPTRARLPGDVEYEAGDYPAAFRIWEPRAERGDPEAQNMLGVMYEWGRGVPQDYQTALRWYHKAAEQGYIAALNNLSGMYQNGKGVPQDYVRAYMWKSLVLSSPSFSYPDDSIPRKLTSSELEDLAGHLTPQQIQQAQAMAQACRAARYQHCGE